MIHGRDRELTATDQLTLAKWAMKSALMYDIHTDDQKGDYFFTGNDCHALFTSEAMPFSNTEMFLAYYKDSPLPKVSLSETHETGAPSLNEHSDYAGLEIYTLTFVIHYLALQVFTLRRSKESARPFQLVIPGSWDAATVRIWPIGGNVTWPPPFILNDNDLRIFTNRWRSPGVLPL